MTRDDVFYWTHPDLLHHHDMDTGGLLRKSAETDKTGTTFLPDICQASLNRLNRAFAVLRLVCVRRQSSKQMTFFCSHFSSSRICLRVLSVSLAILYVSAELISGSPCEKASEACTEDWDCKRQYCNGYDCKLHKDNTCTCSGWGTGFRHFAKKQGGCLGDWCYYSCGSCNADYQLKEGFGNSHTCGTGGVTDCCDRCGEGQSASPNEECAACPRGKYEPTITFSDIILATIAMTDTCKEVCPAGYGRRITTGQTTMLGACYFCDLEDYKESAGAHDCEQCGVNKEGNADRTGCVDCPDGQAGLASEACLSCIPGKYRDADSTTCQPCGPAFEEGGYCPDYGQSAVNPTHKCATGQIPNNEHTACQNCAGDQNKVKVQVVDQTPTCEFCGVLKWATQQLTQDCSSEYCAIGHYIRKNNDESGTMECVQCDLGSSVQYRRGMYKNNNWPITQDSCTLCGQGLFAVNEIKMHDEIISQASMTIKDAIEGDDYILLSRFEKIFKCHNCPAGFGDITVVEANRLRINDVTTNNQYLDSSEINFAQFYTRFPDDDDAFEYLYNLSKIEHVCGMCPPGKFSNIGGGCEACQTGKFTSSLDMNNADQNQLNHQYGHFLTNFEGHDLYMFERVSCLSCMDYKKYTFDGKSNQEPFLEQTPGVFYHTNRRTDDPADTINANTRGTIEDRLLFVTNGGNHEKAFHIGNYQSWIVANIDLDLNLDDLEYPLNEFNHPVTKLQMNSLGSDDALLPSLDMAYETKFTGCTGCAFFYACTGDIFCADDDQCENPECQIYQHFFRESITQMDGSSISTEYKATIQVYFDLDSWETASEPHSKTSQDDFCKLCEENKELVKDDTGQVKCLPCPSLMTREDTSKYDCICADGKFRGAVYLPDGYQDSNICYDATSTESNINSCAVGEYHFQIPFTKAVTGVALYICRPCASTNIDVPLASKRSEEGFDMCSTCPPGKMAFYDLNINVINEKLQCVDCPAGKFQGSDQPAVGAYFDSSINSITFSNIAAHLEFWRNANGETGAVGLDCYMCPMGTYNDQPGQFYESERDCKDRNNYATSGCPCKLCGLIEQTGQSTGQTTCSQMCNSGTVNKISFTTAYDEGVVDKSMYARVGWGDDVNDDNNLWRYLYERSISNFECMQCVQNLGQTSIYAGLVKTTTLKSTSYNLNNKVIELLGLESGYLIQDTNQPKLKCLVCGETELCDVQSSIDCEFEKGVDNKGFCFMCEEGYVFISTDNRQCTYCEGGKYSNDYTKTLRSQNSYECTLVEAGFKACEVIAAANQCDCPEGKYQNLPGQITCKDCEIGKYQDQPKGKDCKECEITEYQNEPGKTQCKPCTEDYLYGCKDSNGLRTGNCIDFPEGGQLTDDHCYKCDEDKNYKTNENGECESCQTNFFFQGGACVACPDGQIVLPGMRTCTECLPCPDGHWREFDENSGSQDCHSTALCKPCEKCQDSSMVRVGCMSNRGQLNKRGECYPRQLVTRTAVCPFSEHLETFKNFYYQSILTTQGEEENEKLHMTDVKTNYGLGGFSFREVFGTSYEKVNFQCRRLCDGTQQKITYTPPEDGEDRGKLNIFHGITNGGQCAGPYACGVQACTMESSMESFDQTYRVPMACPLEDPSFDVSNSEDMNHLTKYLATLNTACETCEECGMRQRFMGPNNPFPDWGRGCAKECSRLVCDDNEIFDWTRPKSPLRDACTTCKNLANISLCSTADILNIEDGNRDITGHFLKIYFQDCVPKYGNVRRYINTEETDPTYGKCKECPEGMCEKENQYPGGCHITFDDDVEAQCYDCIGIEGLVTNQSLYYSPKDNKYIQLYCQVQPCLDGYTGLSDVNGACATLCANDLSCDETSFLQTCRFPHNAKCIPRRPLYSDQRKIVGETTSNVNMFETLSASSQQYSSFENILLNTFIDSKRCVWNAHIGDNFMNPGGVSVNNLETDCRPWDAFKIEKVYPLLPLQNTILLKENDFDLTHDRRILVNTNAIAYSHDTETAKSFQLGSIGLRLELQFQYVVNLYIPLPFSQDTSEDLVKYYVKWESLDWLPQARLSFFTRSEEGSVITQGILKTESFDNTVLQIEVFYDDVSTFEIEMLTISAPDFATCKSDTSMLQKSFEIINVIDTNVFYVSCENDAAAVGCNFSEFDEWFTDYPFLSKLSMMSSLESYNVTSYESISILPDAQIKRISYYMGRPSFDTNCVQYVSSQVAIYCVRANQDVADNKLLTTIFRLNQGPDQFSTPINNFLVIPSNEEKKTRMLVLLRSQDFLDTHLIVEYDHASKNGEVLLYDEEILPFQNNIMAMTAHDDGSLYIFERQNDQSYIITLFSWDSTVKNLTPLLSKNVLVELGISFEPYSFVFATHQHQIILIIPMKRGVFQVSRFNRESMDLQSQSEVTFPNESLLEILHRFTSAPSYLIFDSNDIIFSYCGYVFVMTHDDRCFSYNDVLAFDSQMFVRYKNGIVSTPLSPFRSSEPVTHGDCQKHYIQTLENNIEKYDTLHCGLRLCSNICYEDDECVGYIWIDNVCDLYLENAARSDHYEYNFCKKQATNTHLSTDVFDNDKVVNVVYDSIGMPRLYYHKPAAMKHTKQDNDELKIDANFVICEDCIIDTCEIHASLNVDNYWKRLSSLNGLQAKDVFMTVQNRFLQVGHIVYYHDGQRSNSILKNANLGLISQYFFVTMEYTCDFNNENHKPVSFTVLPGNTLKFPIMCELFDKNQKYTEVVSLWIAQCQYIEGECPKSLVYVHGQMTSLFQTWNQPIQSINFMVSPEVRITTYEKLDSIEFRNRIPLFQLKNTKTQSPELHIDSQWTQYRYTIATEILRKRRGFLINFNNIGEITEPRSVDVDKIELLPVLSKKTFKSFPEICEKGYYAFGMYDCEQCPAGKFAPMTGMTNCLICLAGTYQEHVGSSICTSCVAGKYNSLSGSESNTSCLSCKVGFYAEFQGMASCERCSPGFRASGIEGCVAHDEACIECPSGKKASMNTNESVPRICEVCPVGFYSNVGASDCVACRRGYYSDTLGAANISSCIECPKGTYSSLLGSTGCSNCPPHTYQSTFAATSIEDCIDCSFVTSAFSSEANTDRNNCICGHGSYGVNGNCFACKRHSTSHFNATNIADCTCNAGYEIDLMDASQSCVPCVPGKYKSVSTRNSTCEPCLPGHYSDTYAATSCTLCLPQFTSKQGQTKCIHSPCFGCPVSTYSREIGASHNSSCTACDAGKYSLGYTSTCQLCARGSYRDANVSEGQLCVLCPRGKFSEEEGMTNEEACTTLKSTCHAGYFLEIDSRDCLPCMPGTFSIEHSLNCSKCPIGSYNTEYAADACKLCPRGKTTQLGAQVCFNSPCTSCPVGEYSSEPGLISVRQCIQCKNGKFSPYYNATCSNATFSGTSEASSRRLLQEDVQNVQEADELQIQKVDTRFLNLVTYVPTKEELSALNIDPDTVKDFGLSALRGSNEENWQRLHITVEVQDDDERFIGCEYRVHVGKIVNNITVVENRLQELGCSIVFQSKSSVCFMEIPTAIKNEENFVGIQLHSAVDDITCQWPSSFQVLLEPFTSIYECHEEHFWSETLQECVSCELEITDGMGLDAMCETGYHIKGCDVLAGNDVTCQECPKPSDWTDTRYQWDESTVCQYSCVESYWKNIDSCVPCTNTLQCSNNTAFPPGYRRMNCTDNQNEKCMPCDMSDSGVYAVNEEFVYDDFIECKVDCIEGQYFRYDSKCIPCKSLQQLETLLQIERLHVESQFAGDFYRFDSCTRIKDGTFRRCEKILNGVLIGDALEFDKACQFNCNVGFQKSQDGEECIPCAPLEPGQFFVEAGSGCAVGCNTSLGFYESQFSGCINCSFLCNIGSYHSRSSNRNTCECLPCKNLMRTQNWNFVSAGVQIDDAYSCNIQCDESFFQDFLYCRPFSKLTCSKFEFLVPGNPFADFRCQSCRSCFGKNKTRSCTNVSDTVCEDCPLLPPNRVYVDDACSSTCREGTVLDKRSNVCEICDAQCEHGYHHPSESIRQNCTHCEVCAPLAPPGAKYFDSSCRWFCPDGKEVRDGRCQAQIPIGLQIVHAGGYGCPALKCGYGHIPVPQISKCSQCMPCVDTNVERPPANQENLSWVWLPGLSCRFECMRGYFSFVEGQARECVTESEFESKLQRQILVEDLEKITWDTKQPNSRFSLLLLSSFILICFILTTLMICI